MSSRVMASFSRHTSHCTMHVTAPTRTRTHALIMMLQEHRAGMLRLQEYPLLGPGMALILPSPTAAQAARRPWRRPTHPRRRPGVPACR